MKMVKKISLLLFSSLLALSVACGKASDPESPTEGQPEDNGDTEPGAIDVFTAAGTVSDALAGNCGNHEDDEDYTWNSLQVVQIDLNGTGMTVNGTGVTVDGSKATLTSAGTYRFSGTLADGRIIVDTDDKETVRLILSGAHISCSTSAPVYVKNAEKAVIVLADNTENDLQDGTSYVFENQEEDEPNAALFSKSDLTICGNGSLTVKGRFNDGISSKDGLILHSGKVTVNSVDDGVRGKDYLIVKKGNITVNSGGDALKSDNAEDAAKGYVLIEAGALHLTAGGDAIAAETDALVVNGEITLSSGGGSGSTVGTDASAKGIKGVVSAIIDNGTFTINSADDAVHSNSKVEINGGVFTISTGDDGIHADTTLKVNGGNIRISTCFEGLESRAVTVNNGNIHVISTDDGFNASAGGGGMGGPGGGGPPGQGGGMTPGSFTLTINGGTIAVSSAGDGVDINGSIVMTGGTLLINGPTADMNGAVDYDASFRMTGGLLVAAGSAGMAQAPSAASTQYSLLVNLTSPLAAGALFHIQTGGSENVLSYAPNKRYQSIAFCSSQLKKGATYSIYTGGSSTGAVTDGFYRGGTYSPGTKYMDFTVSSIVTKINAR